MKRCPFCAEKIQVDAEQCAHCGKTLVKKPAESTEKGGLTNLDSWQKKSVPSWFMYLAVAAALFCVWLMFAQGCEKGKVQPDDASAFQHFEPMTLTPGS